MRGLEGSSHKTWFRSAPSEPKQCPSRTWRLIWIVPSRSKLLTSGGNWWTMVNNHFSQLRCRWFRLLFLQIRPEGCDAMWRQMQMQIMDDHGRAWQYTRRWQHQALLLKWSQSGNAKQTSMQRQTVQNFGWVHPFARWIKPNIPNTSTHTHSNYTMTAADGRGQTVKQVWLKRMSYVAILGLARRHEVWCRLHLATCNGLSQDLKVRLKSWDHLVRWFENNQNISKHNRCLKGISHFTKWCGVELVWIGVVLTQVKEEKHVPWWSISVRIHENTLYTLVRMIPFLADERITPECLRHDSWVCSDVVGVVSRYKGYLGLFTELPAKAGMGSTLIHCWQLPNGPMAKVAICCHVATGRFLADLLTTS